MSMHHAIDKIVGSITTDPRISNDLMSKLASDQEYHFQQIRKLEEEREAVRNMMRQSQPYALNFIPSPSSSSRRDTNQYSVSMRRPSLYTNSDDIGSRTLRPITPFLTSSPNVEGVGSNAIPPPRKIDGHSVEPSSVSPGHYTKKVDNFTVTPPSANIDVYSEDKLVTALSSFFEDFQQSINSELSRVNGALSSLEKRVEVRDPSCNCSAQNDIIVDSVLDRLSPILSKISATTSAFETRFSAIDKALAALSVEKEKNTSTELVSAISHSLKESLVLELKSNFSAFNSSHLSLVNSLKSDYLESISLIQNQVHSLESKLSASSSSDKLSSMERAVSAVDFSMLKELLELPSLLPLSRENVVPELLQVMNSLRTHVVNLGSVSTDLSRNLSSAVREASHSLIDLTSNVREDFAELIATTSLKLEKLQTLESLHSLESLHKLSELHSLQDLASLHSLHGLQKLENLQKLESLHSLSSLSSLFGEAELRITTSHASANEALQAAVGAADARLRSIVSHLQGEFSSLASLSELGALRSLLPLVEPAALGRFEASQGLLSSLKDSVESIHNRLMPLQTLESLHKLQGLESLQKLQGLESLQKLQELESLHKLQGLESLQKLQGLESLQKLQGLESLQKLQELESLHKLQGLESLQKLQGLESLQKLEILSSLERLEGLHSLEKLQSLCSLIDLQALEKLTSLEKLHQLEKLQSLENLSSLAPTFERLHDQADALVLRLTDLPKESSLVPSKPSVPLFNHEADALKLKEYSDESEKIRQSVTSLLDDVQAALRAHGHEVKGLTSELSPLKELSKLSELNDLSKLLELKDLSKLTELKDLSKLTELNDLFKLLELKDLSKLTELKDLSKLTELKDLSKLEELKDLSKLEELSKLFELNILPPRLQGVVEAIESATRNQDEVAGRLKNASDAISVLRNAEMLKLMQDLHLTLSELSATENHSLEKEYAGVATSSVSLGSSFSEDLQGASEKVESDSFPSPIDAPLATPTRAPVTVPSGPLRSLLKSTLERLVGGVREELRQAEARSEANLGALSEMIVGLQLQGVESLEATHRLNVSVNHSAFGIRDANSVAEHTSDRILHDISSASIASNS